MLPARVCAIDHSHKITKHIVTINGVPVFIGLLTVTNEMGEIRVIALVATKAHAQFEIALVNMRESLKLYGLEAPELFYTDNISDKGFLEKCFPSLLKEVQPVDKYANYPLYSIPDGVSIHVKSNASQFQVALACIHEKLSELDESDSVVIGFDTEWNVDRTSGNSRQGKTAVVAISFENHIFVLQISQYTKAGKLPVAIKNILADERILKVGRGIKNDLKRLQTEGNIKDSWKNAFHHY